ncbi:NAD-dependent dehydratase [Rhodoligotrophos defluvii]|uniref:NAD-dependent dehydratase n=1 Tax=Rhodoligotrophos defluvii TaxID=2561934 RepID=UPI0010CA03DC|nr:NAD-dependent dehydratase [Rhodoligotrophos defluvii]
MTDTVRNGVVDWTGDNPYIYLKEDPAGDWSSLCLFFRIVASRFGRGHAILILENPYTGEDPGAIRLCLTDNEPLSRFLLDDFVRKFGLFRQAVALDKMVLVTDARFTTEAEYPTFLCEKATHAGGEAILCWEGLGEPFAVDVPPERSQTGRHEMFSVFQPASSAWASVNGKRVRGNTVERDFFDRRVQSAALAHSETWVRF